VSAEAATAIVALTKQVTELVDEVRKIREGLESWVPTEDPEHS